MGAEVSSCLESVGDVGVRKSESPLLTRDCVENEFLFSWKARYSLASTISIVSVRTAMRVHRL